MRYLILFTMLASALVAGCNNPLWRQLKPHSGIVTITNDSGEGIRTGHLTVCGQRFDLSHMPPGQPRSFSFRVTADDDFHVEVMFESSRTITRRVGYVTSGFDFNDKLDVVHDDVRLESSRASDHHN